MPTLTIDDESIDTSGALSVYHAASDELERRYGGVGDGHLQIDELKPPLGLFLVARYDHHLAGCVGLRPIGEANEHIGEVKRLWVRVDLRRLGFAAALMSAVEERARRGDYRRLYLETGPAQPEAIAFYAKTNWRSIDEFPPGVFAHPNSHRFTKVLQAN